MILCILIKRNYFFPLRFAYTMIILTVINSAILKLKFAQIQFPIPWYTTFRTEIKMWNNILSNKICRDQQVYPGPRFSGRRILYYTITESDIFFLWHLNHQLLYNNPNIFKRLLMLIFFSFFISLKYTAIKFLKIWLNKTIWV